MLFLSAAVQRVTPKPAVEPLQSLRYGAKDADYGRRDPGAGHRGQVRQLQLDLTQLGHFDSHHGATGGYFDATRAAVKAFQAKKGLPATGQADGATLTAIRAALKGQGQAPAPTPAPPKDTYKPAPGKDKSPLEKMSHAELAQLGKTDKAAFFAALRPAAEEVERRYGVPAEVTMAQVAYESGWAGHVPGGNSFNLFGHKGVGPAGSVSKLSWERNRTELVRSSFRKYHNFQEAVLAHGEKYRNSGYYTKAMAGVDRGERDARTFLTRIEGIYHRDGSAYTNAVMSIIKKYRLA